MRWLKMPEISHRLQGFFLICSPLLNHLTVVVPNAKAKNEAFLIGRNGQRLTLGVKNTFYTNKRLYKNLLKAMKKILTLSAVLFAANLLLAQVEVELTIENQI